MSSTHSQPEPAAHPPIDLSSFAGGHPVGGGGWIERVNPADTTELVGRVEQVDRAGAVAAVTAAHTAFLSWRATPLEQRCAQLLAAADSVAASAEEFGPLLARELGKVVGDCRGEMGFAAACLRWCVEHAEEALADQIVDDDLGRLVVSRIPYGVVTAIVPWNAPLILSILKVAPALVTGNTIIVKPSPIAPLAVTAALSRVAEHLPPGVLSVVHGGPDVGETLVAHELVRKVAFTGGGVTAVAVGRAAAATITPMVLELGGNDPALVLDDVAFTDSMMERLIFGTFLTSGQVCMAAKRIYVPRARIDEFVGRYVEVAAELLVLGDPLDPTVTVGPMASPQQRQIVEDLVADAVSRGGVVHQLGTVAAGTDMARGWFLQPTLVSGVEHDAPIVQLEQFGPTVPVVGYESVADALVMANDSDLGLASSVWSDDEHRAFEVARSIEAGMTFINCHNRAGMSLRAPFGGVKQSGFGREFGMAGLSEYLQSHSLHAPAMARPGAAHAAANSYPGQ